MVSGEERGARQFVHMARQPVSGLSFLLHARSSYLWRRRAVGEGEGGWLFLGWGSENDGGPPRGDSCNTWQFRIRFLLLYIFLLFFTIH